MKTAFPNSLLTLAMAASLITVAQADDWTSSKEVTEAAGGLADSARQLHKSIHAAAADSPLVEEMDQLAKSARKFHEAVKNGATYGQATKDFQKIRSSYDHFEEALKKDHDAHHDEHVVADAKKTKAAFGRLQAHMEGRRESKPTPAPTPSRPGR